MITPKGPIVDNKISSRLHDLIVKLISVKTIAALVITVAYFLLAAKTTVEFGLLATMWMAVVGARTYEKVKMIVGGNGG